MTEGVTLMDEWGHCSVIKRPRRRRRLVMTNHSHSFSPRRTSVGLRRGRGPRRGWFWPFLIIFNGHYLCIRRYRDLTFHKTILKNQVFLYRMNIWPLNIPVSCITVAKIMFISNLISFCNQGRTPCGHCTCTHIRLRVDYRIFVVKKEPGSRSWRLRHCQRAEWGWFKWGSGPGRRRASEWAGKSGRYEGKA